MQNLAEELQEVVRPQVTDIGFAAEHRIERAAEVFQLLLLAEIGVAVEPAGHEDPPMVRQGLDDVIGAEAGAPQMRHAALRHFHHQLIAAKTMPGPPDKLPVNVGRGPVEELDRSAVRRVRVDDGLQVRGHIVGAHDRVHLDQEARGVLVEEELALGIEETVGQQVRHNVRGQRLRFVLGPVGIVKEPLKQCLERAHCDAHRASRTTKWTKLAS